MGRKILMLIIGVIIILAIGVYLIITYIDFGKYSYENFDFSSKEFGTLVINEGDSYAMQITSYDELETVLNQFVENADGDVSIIENSATLKEKYDIDYFLSNNLILVIMEVSSSSVSYDVTDLSSEVDSEELDILIEYSSSEITTVDAVYKSFLIETSKENFQLDYETINVIMKDSNN